MLRSPSNVRNCLRSRFDRVIVVATDERAMKAVETALARVALLIPGRVEIVLQDGASKLASGDEDEASRVA